MARRLPPWATGLMGALGILAFWWISSVTIFANVGSGNTKAIPTPVQVIQGYADVGWDFYARNFAVTLNEAAQGYLWGNGLALVLAGLVLVVPKLEGVVNQLAVITYCIPIVAIGPIVLLIVGPPKSGEPSGTAVFLAALSVFFTTVVGALLGLKSADKASLDVVEVYGGSRMAQLRKVRVIAAAPAILTALQIAVPAAFLGAVLGEYFGKVETGVGPAMVIAQQSLNSPRVWGIALASGAVALTGYLLVGLLTRLATPWSRGAAA
ncbi:ABC transporter permease [Demequina lignilytica]|uniref:ABC transporter permease subunit n=1 Tax=Demequina lignilytica TaxID=3051663 RepID=A0AAW7M4C0_9MICO|nr:MULTISPECIES: ABC transporter permease subunit [unclassified Demequina]MDN4478821.1 ABC transporter permease subunit [Demequina sp. SYSU T00039-1]MDN4484080.1 ABC transporter permease subunit [Demequina sp. SYSU T0a273]MDN4488919.1 ABC transporter permease subunit [Demequina sp. SYSU T00039]MDN4490337.1 ABC transporter permease subunit [Demequina sp. SYSU T00068]